MTQKQILRARARRLRSQMRKIASMMQGSVIFRQMKCGKPNCRCTRGYPHSFLVVTYKEEGKTKTVYVNKNRQAEALLLSKNYKECKKLIKQLTKVNLQILRLD